MLPAGHARLDVVTQIRAKVRLPRPLSYLVAFKTFLHFLWRTTTTRSSVRFPRNAPSGVTRRDLQRRQTHRRFTHFTLETDVTNPGRRYPAGPRCILAHGSLFSGRQCPCSTLLRRRRWENGTNEA